MAGTRRRLGVSLFAAMIVSVTSLIAQQKPTATTTAATAVSYNSANLNGTINPNGSATDFWFEWGTSSSLTMFNSTLLSSAGSGSAPVNVSMALTGLSANTSYYFRIGAQNSLGITRSTVIMGFTTPPIEQKPAVDTLGATSVTLSSARLNGTVTPNNAVTSTWFEWGTSSTLATYNLTPPQDIGFGSSAVAVAADINSLAENTTYYYRVAATNSAGTVRASNILSFRTIAITQSDTRHFPGRGVRNIRPSGQSRSPEAK